MNKKIFAVFTLFVLVTSISAVSAFDLGDILGTSENKTVTIEGITFNIPAGYKEDSTSTLDVIEFIDEGYDFDGKVYAKDNITVGIYVYNYSSLDSDDFLEDLVNETTITDAGEFIEFDDNEYVFIYTKDKCIVLVASNDQNAIGDFTTS